MNNFNISQHRSSVSSSPQSQTQSVAPQSQSDPPQPVGPQTQSVPPQLVALQTQSEFFEVAKWAINPNEHPGENVVQMQGAAITRSNIRRLLNGQLQEDMYLDDEVIHFFFARLMERANAYPTILPKTYCFSTQFMISQFRNNWKKHKFSRIRSHPFPHTSNKPQALGPGSRLSQTKTNRFLRFDRQTRRQILPDNQRLLQSPLSTRGYV